MNLKKIIIIFLPIIFIISESIAKEHNFIIKKDKNGIFSLVLELQEGEIIYSNKKNNPNIFPSSIKIHPQKNLKNYTQSWPKSKSTYQEGIGEIEYFDKQVVVLLNLEAYDYSKPIYFKADIEFVICSDQCTPVKQTIEETIILTEPKRHIWQYIGFMVAALIGGFILNFMPCVLPVLSLKIISFTKNHDIDRKMASMLTVTGVFSAFWCLAGLLIILKETGRQFGLGVNFQIPEFIILLTIVITIFISMAMDRINFPSSTVLNKAYSLNFNNPYIDHYFSGIIATILSTPCNAPFLGSALAFAFAINNFMVILMFTLIAFGFSIPYFLLIISPQILNILPKSGPWMAVLKKFLVLMLIGTLIWLLWVLSSQIGNRAVLGLFFLLLLLKFTLENNSKLLRNKYIKILTILVICINSIFLPRIAYQEDKAHVEFLTDTWQKFDYSAISHLVKQRNIVLVDITADWCVTCKYNKLMVLNRDHTLKLLEHHKVFAMRGNYTSQNKEIYDFLKSHGSIGIPFYIIFGPSKPEGVILPVIIKYTDIKNAIEIVK